MPVNDLELFYFAGAMPKLVRRGDPHVLKWKK